MKSIIVDTHALVWFFEGNKLLSKQARHLLVDAQAPLLIHAIVLCELLFVLRKGNKHDLYDSFLSQLEEDKRVSIIPLFHDQIPLIPKNMEMHDGLLAALCLQKKGSVILTKDSKLKQWDSSRVTW